MINIKIKQQVVLDLDLVMKYNDSEKRVNNLNTLRKMVQDSLHGQIGKVCYDISSEHFEKAVPQNMDSLCEEKYKLELDELEEFIRKEKEIFDNKISEASARLRVARGKFILHCKHKKVEKCVKDGGDFGHDYTYEKCSDCGKHL